jgi:hypothetical protein
VTKTFAERAGRGRDNRDNRGASGTGGGGEGLRRMSTERDLRERDRDRDRIDRDRDRDRDREREGLGSMGQGQGGIGGMGHQDCLLYQLARCFRKRIFKAWEALIESNRISISVTFPAGMGMMGGMGGMGMGGMGMVGMGAPGGNGQVRVATEVDEHAPYMKYIEDIAFRVPLPVTSGGMP